LCGVFVWCVCVLHLLHEARSNVASKANSLGRDNDPQIGSMVVAVVLKRCVGVVVCVERTLSLCAQYTPSTMRDVWDISNDGEDDVSGELSHKLTYLTDPQRGGRREGHVGQAICKTQPGTDKADSIITASAVFHHLAWSYICAQVPKLARAIHPI